LHVVAHRKLAIFRRRVFTALSVLSLLLCIATLALWVRSYWCYDEILAFYVSDPKSYVGDPIWSLESLRGQVAYLGCWNEVWVAFPTVTVMHYGFIYEWAPAANVGALLESALGSGWLGFTVLWPDGRAISGPTSGVAVPHWFLALLFAILPALYLRAMLRSRRRHLTGHCPHCGYDLRATPARCPECGLLTAETRRTQSESVC
jgi:hypothetical protein